MSHPWQLFISAKVWDATTFQSEGHTKKESVESREHHRGALAGLLISNLLGTEQTVGGLKG